MSKIKKPVLMPKADRREAALKIAVKLAQKVGAARVSVAAVAAQMKVTAPLLFHIFESKEGMTKAIVKAAKSQGVALPAAVPTVREQRAAGKKSTPAVKPKKLAALLKPKTPALAKLPMKKVPTPAARKKVAEANVRAVEKLLAPAPARKPLTAAQREAKRSRDAARRAPAAAPTTPAGKFASLPAPFEASLAAVSQ